MCNICSLSFSFSGPTCRPKLWVKSRGHIRCVQWCVVVDFLSSSVAILHLIHTLWTLQQQDVFLLSHSGAQSQLVFPLTGSWTGVPNEVAVSIFPRPTLSIGSAHKPSFHAAVQVRLEGPATYDITSVCLHEYLLHIQWTDQSMRPFTLPKCQTLIDRNCPQRSHLELLGWMSSRSSESQQTHKLVRDRDNLVKLRPLTSASLSGVPPNSWELPHIYLLHFTGNSSSTVSWPTSMLVLILYIYWVGSHNHKKAPWAEEKTLISRYHPTAAHRTALSRLPHVFFAAVTLKQVQNGCQLPRLFILIKSTMAIHSSGFHSVFSVFILLITHWDKPLVIDLLSITTDHGLHVNPVTTLQTAVCVNL